MKRKIIDIVLDKMIVEYTGGNTSSQKPAWAIPVGLGPATRNL